jgi:hypothetical protein
VESYEDSIQYIEKFMRCIYVLFEDSGFNFNPNDQTLEYHSFPKIKNQRRVLINNYMRAAKLEVTGGSAT